MRITKKYLDELTYKVNGAAIEVHQHLGAGLLESVYHECLKHELKLQGIVYETEVEIPIKYKGVTINSSLRCDLFIENILTVELKSVKQVLPIHESQLISYMQLLGSPKGILFNFNVANLINAGQKTYVNKFFSKLPQE